MSLLFRKFAPNNARNVVLRHKEVQVIIISHRKLSIVPSLYGKLRNFNDATLEINT